MDIKMANDLYSKWKEPCAYTKGQIDRAGFAVKENPTDSEAIKIIQAFRAAHLYPLMIIKNFIWQNVKNINNNAVTARRLKRLPTIIDKMSRKTLDGKTVNKMKLSRMQDVGGCRVILDDISQVIKLNARLDKSRTVHSSKVTDYNNKPKENGYRGVHRIYKCYDKVESHDRRGFNIEVQIRTYLQHLWATTIEVVDLCESKSLKTNSYEDDSGWNEFFKMMSDVLANQDGLLQLDNKEKAVLKNNLFKVAENLKAIEKLESFNKIFSNERLLIENASKKFVVIAVKANEKTVYYDFFREKEKENALEAYAEAESYSDVNAIFVEMDDFKKLKTAYPNYLIDTRGFISKYDDFINSHFWVSKK